MHLEPEVLIIGGGLAGLTAAIHLKRLGFAVALIEKQAYPHHKVCGEYISNEVLPYLKWLGLDPISLSPTEITDLQFDSWSGKKIHTKLLLGGFGLSRYTFDHYLYQFAKASGVNFITDKVVSVVYLENKFSVVTAAGKTLGSSYVLGAYGKRSSLDLKLEREFISKNSPYLAVKAHYKSTFPNHLVNLNSFPGGYCGVSKVENDRLNICYLASFKSFKKYKTIKAYQENVLYQNKNLKTIFETSEMILEAPLTISQISFENKEPVVNHILMIGDTAGLIHPLCGNGMAMAVHSAKIACESIEKHYITRGARAILEQDYRQSWQKLFSLRLRFGRLLSTIMQHRYGEQIAITALSAMPFLLRNMIKCTHGKPLKATN